MTELSDGTYTAVVDRLEGDSAVVLVEDEQTVIDELTLDTTALPTNSQQADSILGVEIVDGDIKNIQPDPSATQTRRDQAQSRFDRLSERPPTEASREDDDI